MAIAWRGTPASRARFAYNRPVTTPSLSTSIGDFVLHEYRLTLGGSSWSFLHTGAVVTMAQEQEYLAHEEGRLPYGAMLWPASIALAHDLMERADALRGKRVLELGAGTGVPGIVAASLGATVLQVDRSEVALHLCAMNAQRNGQEQVQAHAAEWETFHSEQPFDFIIGADVLYVTPMHERLRTICEAYLTSDGIALFADPFRAQSLPMLEAMEERGFRVSLAKWSIGVESGTRAIAVYEAARR
jgi:predicted nicotinamide N-methyase